MEKVKKVQTDQKTGAQAADPMTGAEALDPVYRRRCLLGSLCDFDHDLLGDLGESSEDTGDDDFDADGHPTDSGRIPVLCDGRGAPP